MGRTKNQQRKKYTEQQLFSAIQAVNNGLTQFAAAKKFGIPRSTLFNKISGKTLLGKKPGPSTVLLPEEERTIEKWVFGLAVRGFPVTKRQLLRSIQLYLNIKGSKTVFTNNLPGRKWYNSFRRRHPKISEKISQNLTIRRAAITADKIRSWHAEITKYCEEHDLLDALNDPTRVFNMDEKGFVLTPNNEVVLVQRGDKAVYNRSKNDEKENVSALLGGSASGKMTPPMMIHSYKRMPRAVMENMPAKWNVGLSDSGWQTQKTFHDYMVIFSKWLLEEKVQLPVIVFIDGHKSHVSLTLSDFCAENRIELIALYPNSTHLTQPMDVGVFKPLNTAWTNEAKDWRINNQFAKIEKKDVAPILEKAINSIKYSEHLKNAFKKSGIFPFDVENIDLSRVLPSIAASATPQEELWNPQEVNVPDTATHNIENVAVATLQRFEQLIGTSVLNSFRSSADVWTGAEEYSVLFTIWKRMYKEAAMSTENSENVLVEIVNIDQMSTDFTSATFIVDDGTWMMEEMDSSIVEVNAAETSSSSVADFRTSTMNGSIEDFCERDRGALISGDVGVSSASVPDSRASAIKESIKDSCGRDRGASEDAGVSSTPARVADSEQRSVNQNEHPEISIPDRSTYEPVETSDKFSPAAFKEAFFWPLDDRKKSKKQLQPKISSVMSSEDWRQHERLKMEEKQRLQDEKGARKEAREAKKIEASKMAAEKLLLKERKIVAAKKVAEAKLLNRKNARKIEKLSRKATKVIEKL